MGERLCLEIFQPTLNERAPTQSYGGFMSSKVVEANAGVHSLAMAIAVCFSPLDLPAVF